MLKLQPSPVTSKLSSIWLSTVGVLAYAFMVWWLYHKINMEMFNRAANRTQLFCSAYLSLNTYCTQTHSQTLTRSLNDTPHNIGRQENVSETTCIYSDIIRTHWKKTHPLYLDEGNAWLPFSCHFTALHTNILCLGNRLHMVGRGHGPMVGVVMMYWGSFVQLGHSLGLTGPNRPGSLSK